jgi:very-short-patch-repair endonuclease
MKADRQRLELLSRRTQAERAAAQTLLQMGYSVIAQYPIQTATKRFYADIYIIELHCILEIDGAYHYTRQQLRLDKNRSALLRKLGFHVVRLSNRDAYSASKIAAKLARSKKNV